MDDLCLPFPIELLIPETPRSHQSTNAPAKERWKQVVRHAAKTSIDALTDFAYLDDRPLALTILYFPPEPMQGDIDNIVKLILDGMIGIAYLDDRVIERITVQKFEPHITISFNTPTRTLDAAVSTARPALYIRIDDDLHWRQAQ